MSKFCEESLRNDSTVNFYIVYTGKSKLKLLKALSDHMFSLRYQVKGAHSASSPNFKFLNRYNFKIKAE